MTRVIVAHASPTLRNIRGDETVIVPAVMAEKGVTTRLGVGYINAGTGFAEFEGSAFPVNLIQSWRAMKILAAAPHIDRDTFMECWTVAQPTLTPHDVRTSFAALARNMQPARRDIAPLPKTAARAVLERIPFASGLFNGATQTPPCHLTDIRNKTLRLLPSEAELGSMLDILLKHEVYDPVPELEAYVRAGQLPRLPQIATMRQLYDAQLQGMLGAYRRPALQPK